MRDLPRKARVFILSVVLAAAGLLTWLRLERGQELHAKEILGFGLLFLLSEAAPIRTRHLTVSVSFLVVVAAVASVGPEAAAFAAIFAGYDRGRRPVRMLFNGAQYPLAAAVAGFGYVAAGGAVGRLDATMFPAILGPLVVASVLFWTVNAGLAASVHSLSSGVPLRQILLDGSLFSVQVNMLAFAVLGVLLGGLYLQMGFAAALFLLVPIMSARRALQAAADMDEGYEATLRALVTAIEAKDAYTRGHAERVSVLSAMIARELKMSELTVRRLRYAALMHDVGKLVVSTTVLTKPGKLTAEEYEHMKAHPVHGCEVIEEIDFLRDGEAVDAVRHHHERLDGRGYPDNLSGDEVPLTARIVMVADAFDSMTSTRSYRPAMPVERAMTELRRCAATQFDPQMIAALDRAIVRNGWQPSPEAFLGEQTARPAASVHAAHA